MKAIVGAVVALSLAVPVVSFAQASGQSLTRAQVRADLIQAENAGYSPTAWADFPYGEVQAAKFRLAEHKAAKAESSGYGSSSGGRFQAGDIAR
ncbi:membrane protein [Caballeronia novacaledonica]|uniref:Membrane protein n=2 Tax=Caballeronia novacaledonica TaxID=1544861 RepID=A0A2U3HZH9_9BURK|nr:DUF4148 domain-containing protein [Caballeronia novacaledonica]SPB13224.1 membrane protein [Caballeronia novacaledonica]